MIHSSDRFGESQSFKLLPVENFKNIQPNSASSLEEAKEYWDNVFDKLRRL